MFSFIFLGDIFASLFVLRVVVTEVQIGHFSLSVCPWLTDFLDGGSCEFLDA